MSHIQSALGADGSPSPSLTTYTVAFPVAVAAGNAVFGVVSWDSTNGTAIASIKDDKANTYPVLNLINDAATTQAAAAFALAGIVNAPKALTITFSAARIYVRAAIDEYSGVSAIDAHGGQLVAGSTAASSGPVTTTVDGDTIWGASVITNGTGTFAAGSGFAARNNSAVGSNVPMLTEDKVQASAGAVAATATVSGSLHTVSFIAAAKPSGKIDTSLSLVLTVTGVVTPPAAPIGLTVVPR